MTEYEILDVLATVNGNAVTATGVYFSVLTAYCLVAYVVGAKLTRYQVTFINVVFLVYNLIAALNVASMVNRQLLMSNRLAEISAATRLIGEEGSALIIAIFVMLRVLLVVGALGFMWQVRHAKTERPS
jgi:hypothetical protein